MKATVERPMSKFLGKPRESGEVIGEDEMAQISDQARRALVDAGYLKIDGMVSSVGMGMDQHLRARVDTLQARIDRQDGVIADLTSRVSELMSLLPGKGKRKEV